MNRPILIEARALASIRASEWDLIAFAPLRETPFTAP